MVDEEEGQRGIYADLKAELPSASLHISPSKNSLPKSSSPPLSFSTPHEK
jgi:hypothetical protein